MLHFVHEIPFYCNPKLLNCTENLIKNFPIQKCVPCKSIETFSTFSFEVTTLFMNILPNLAFSNMIKAFKFLYKTLHEFPLIVSSVLI